MQVMESSSAKVYMNAPGVCKLYGWMGRVEKNTPLMINLLGFFSHFNLSFFCCQFTTLVKDSRHAWSIFEANAADTTI